MDPAEVNSEDQNVVLQMKQTGVTESLGGGGHGAGPAPAGHPHRARGQGPCGRGGAQLPASCEGAWRPSVVQTSERKASDTIMFSVSGGRL